MARKLVLFDIDGTLLLTGGAGGRAMERAGRALFGAEFRWDGIQPGGGLDPLLLQEAADQSGLEMTPEQLASFRSTYVRLLGEELAGRPDDVRVMPGVREILADLATREREIALGLLTGNWGDSATLKLEAARIELDLFRVRVWGDDGPSRPALVPVALRRFHEAYRREIEGRDVIVVGDTVRDVECARENGCVAVAVATGASTRDELAASEPDHLLDDLADAAPLLALLRD